MVSLPHKINDKIIILYLILLVSLSLYLEQYLRNKYNITYQIWYYTTSDKFLKYT